MPWLITLEKKLAREINADLIYAKLQKNFHYC